MNKKANNYFFKKSTLALAPMADPKPLTSFGFRARLSKPKYL